MTQYIDKSALVAEIKKRRDICKKVVLDLRTEENKDYYQGKAEAYKEILPFLDTLEVKDTYEQFIQYPSIEAAIKSHAEDYSWNIESELFQQLTPEQQKLWRKEIEQACISGGYSGLNLAKDPRYKENLEVKDGNLEKELDEWIKYGPHTNYPWCTIPDAIKITAEHFFELGIKAQKGE